MLHLVLGVAMLTAQTMAMVAHMSVTMVLGKLQYLVIKQQTYVLFIMPFYTYYYQQSKKDKQSGFVWFQTWSCQHNNYIFVTF